MVGIIAILGKVFGFLFREFGEGVSDIKNAESVNKKVVARPKTPREECEDFFPGLLEAAEMAERYSREGNHVYLKQIEIRAMPEKYCYRLIITSVVINSDAPEEDWENYFRPEWVFDENERGYFIYKDIYPRYTEAERGDEDVLTNYLSKVHPEWRYSGPLITFM